MTLSLGSGILVAVLVARMVLPPAVRLLAKHASTELYQLTLISFCLCSSWLSGYMVRLQLPPPLACLLLLSRMIFGKVWSRKCRQNVQLEACHVPCVLRWTPFAHISVTGEAGTLQSFSRESAKC